MGILHQIEAEVKALQEPHDDGGDQDDREGPVKEILRLLPEKLRHVLRAGQTVVRQFHHERHCLAPEQRALEQVRRQDAVHDAQDIESRDDEPALPREKGVHEKAVDRQLRRA